MRDNLDDQRCVTSRRMASNVFPDNSVTTEKQHFDTLIKNAKNKPIDPKFHFLFPEIKISDIWKYFMLSFIVAILLGIVGAFILVYVF